MNKFSHGDEITPADEWEDDRCVLCGRKVGSNPAMVHFVDGGSVVHAESEPFPEGWVAGDMGYFPAGNECAKKFAPGVLLGEKSLLNAGGMIA